jgi:hypothetical protein
MNRCTTLALGTMAMLSVVSFGALAQTAPPTYQGDPSVYKVIFEDQNFRVIEGTWNKGQHDKATRTRFPQSSTLSPTAPFGFTNRTARPAISSTRPERRWRYRLHSRIPPKISVRANAGCCWSSGNRLPLVVVRDGLRAHLADPRRGPPHRGELRQAAGGAAPKGRRPV